MISQVPKERTARGKASVADELVGVKTGSEPETCPAIELEALVPHARRAKRHVEVECGVSWGLVTFAVSRGLVN